MRRCNCCTMTASVQPVCSSHARSLSNSFTFVPNRRTSPAGFSLASPIITQTNKNFLPTSIPGTSFTFHFQHGLLLNEEKPTLHFSICLTGLKAPIGGSLTRQPDHFPNGVVPPLNKRPFLFVRVFSRFASIRSNANLFILGGGPQGHETFLSSRGGFPFATLGS